VKNLIGTLLKQKPTVSREQLELEMTDIESEVLN